jgi:hypothetical protein
VNFIIMSHTGESHTVDAPNWMMAMAKAMGHFNLEPASMGRWVCTPMGAGTVTVEDPKTDQSWLVREVPEGAEAPVVAPPSRPSMPPQPAPAAVAPPPPPAFAAPTPSIAAPPSSAGAAAIVPSPVAVPVPVSAPAPEPEEEPETLAERLFDLSFDIAESNPPEAARLSLELIEEFVQCEAASIVRGTLNDTALTFLAASGPVGGSIIGKKVPFGKGLIGLCFDMGLTVQVNDVAREERHYNDLDRQTGFQTRSSLCVPIRDEEGNAFGVIQLLNPKAAFSDWNIETVETVARTLVGPLGAGA